MATVDLAEVVDPSLVLLTVEEAARRLQIGRTLCYRFVSSGELESITLGHLRRIPADAVPEFATRLRKRQNPTRTITVTTAA
ncbi:excisionase family DNA-binding protein [Streptomyces sp. NBC_01334]|uniref:excisionase family DNA-binding protein n=1 Tax=Streptomyces sp. NBC_01334 TaxID=2903827 RepID=UPI002E1570C1|nr:excisionase family DNA-binding protein [Streptomyces sp. NBC_01334]